MVYSAYRHSIKDQKEIKTARTAQHAHENAMRHRELIISNRNGGGRDFNPAVGSENITIEHSAMKQLKNSTQPQVS